MNWTSSHGAPTLAFALSALAVLGCGDDDGDCAAMGPLPEPNLDPSRLLSELTAEESGHLCDWGVSQLGGYCAMPRCETGEPVTVARSRERCIRDMPRSPSCTATVGDQVECVEVVRARPCEATLFLDSACAPLLDCALEATAAAPGLAFPPSRPHDHGP